MAPRTLILACGALAREIGAVLEMNRWGHATLLCLPSELHNHPEKIPGQVREKLAELAGDYDRILVGYADCGTGGLLDPVVAEFGAQRLPGAHCYGFFAGLERFAELAEQELGTFYLTDFMVRQFDTIIWKGLGLDRHPELERVYFEHYKRVLYLSQHEDPAMVEKARGIAERMNMTFEHVHTGYGLLPASIEAAVAPATA